MKIGKLKQLLAKCDDEAEIFVVNGGSHHLEVVALAGSTDKHENLAHGYGILVGTQDVLRGYIQRIDQMILKNPLEAAAWRRRKDFWLDEAKTLEAIDAVIVEESKPEPPNRVRIKLHSKNRKHEQEES